VTANGPKGGTIRRGRSTGDGAARGRRAALAREHRRRPCSEESLKIPIARGLFPAPAGPLSPCMAWTAKFGTITGKERKSKEGCHIGYLDIPTGHLWLTRCGQGIATCAPLRLTFQYACPVVAVRSTHTHMGGVSVLSHTCWGGKASNGANSNRAGAVLPEQETFMTQ
jgi:hypothetical protein